MIGGALLEDLLEAALRGAVSPIERQSVAVLVAEDLDLQVPGLAAQLHHEDGRARYLRLHIGEGDPELLVVGGLADALSTAALGGFDHHWVADPVCACQRFLHRVDHGLHERLLWDRPLGCELSNEAIAAPRNWELRVLTRMPPARPDGVHALLLRNLADELHVGIVVHVLAGGNLHVGVRKADELCIRIEVVLRGHRNEGQYLLGAKLHEGPPPHRHD
eukprot:CAMPEP_0175615686 /NCGR_PEP_ID=MMETSP0096-20121207/65497_1 /TAXON_ID=311494 /ORGANISM="Alexandrium monilatum, Strain CCMP3105" /LENGTH=218 /DNA_ID=CAMNT_0016920831 /DNA_START=190 /DNA_END=842 /DNA_ORIENTATION=-